MRRRVETASGSPTSHEMLSSSGDLSKRLYAPHVASNKQKLRRLQDVMSLALGVAAGAMALESMYGFGFFLIGITAVNAFFYGICCAGTAGAFYTSPMWEIFVEGVGSSVAGYIMMWCLTYTLVK